MFGYWAQHLVLVSQQQLLVCPHEVAETTECDEFVVDVSETLLM